MAARFIDPSAPVDLTNCDREPIHQLGRVQSYGALLALDDDWTVRHASANLADIAGVETEAIIGQPLSDHFGEASVARLIRAARGADLTQEAIRLFALPFGDRVAPFDASLHRSGPFTILELEPKAGRRSEDIMAEVHPHIRKLQGHKSLDEVARSAAQSLAAMSGFDSVMVYEFQPDRSGRVIAETRADGATRYLGLNFPASDIPAQARALYKRALLRLIANVKDAGVPIVPPTSRAGTPIDLSLAVTRAVSPIHIEYLTNMGVGASMSVSIMKDGELWGLFACHHDAPLYIDYERRSAIEMFAHLFSYELSRYQSKLRAEAEANANVLQTRILSRLTKGSALGETLLPLSRDIARVIQHDGFALYHDGVYTATGDAPTEEAFLGLLDALKAQSNGTVFTSNEISRLGPLPPETRDQVAGVLAIPISRQPRDFVLLFRRPLVDQVSWAGDPAKAVEIGPNGTRLTPRKSFETWRETVRGKSEDWSDHARHAAELVRVALLEVFLTITEANNAERKRAQEHQQLLISELNHRVRNILNLMQGLVSQASDQFDTLEGFTAKLDGRIHALARAHDQLTREKFEPTPLKELIRCEFEAYAEDQPGRVTITGPDALISPQAYTALALVVHEMATNSMKYGALCDTSGRVSVDIHAEDDGSLAIDWTEAGGPPVRPPTRRGFGSTIIERSIPHDLGGEARIDYRLTGVTARFTLPRAHVAEVRHDETDAPAPPAADNAAGDFTLSGHGLIVEDTLIIALDAEGIFEDLGARRVTIASNVERGLAAVEAEDIDFALLDVNLGEVQSLPIAEALHAKGVPFVLATGYGETEALVESYPPCKIVQKPFSADSLRAAFKALAGG